MSFIEFQTGNSTIWSSVSKNSADPFKLIKITQAQTFEPEELSDPGDHTLWSTLPQTECTAIDLSTIGVKR
jgi:hypothetical protein